ncbi:MAG: DNA repair protein RecN, partial [Proteobacteria bacterium]|nr:DNA repair protein RecN [Pseudomonadota bacterium]
MVHQIGRLLIDIHGQSEHLALLDRKYHLNFLDAFGGTEELRHRFVAELARFRVAEKELAILLNEVSDRARREDFLRFQINEIQEAKLQEDEEEILAQERQILSSTEKLKSLSYEIHKAISGDESHFSSTLDQLHQAGHGLRELVNLDPKLTQQADSLEATIYEIEEIARDVRSYADGLEYDPARLAEVELRFDLIHSLKRKYGDSIAEIMVLLESAETELESLSSSTE